jgi:hypothetical protein
MSWLLLPKNAVSVYLHVPLAKVVSSNRYNS